MPFAEARACRAGGGSARDAKSVPVRPKPVATSSQIEQDVVLGAGRRERGDVVGVGDPHAGGALHERLDHDRGELGGVACDEGDRLVGPARVVVAGRAQDGEAQRVEDVGAEAAVAERERADRVPVVGVRRARGTACVPSRPWFAQYWNAILSACSTAGGAVAREEEVRVVDRDDGRQRLGELDRRPGCRCRASWSGRRGRAGRAALVELGDAVAERRDPQRRDGVEVAAASASISSGPRRARRRSARLSAYTAIWVKPCHTTAASRSTQSLTRRSLPPVRHSGCVAQRFDELAADGEALERLALELADALARDAEDPPDLLERVRGGRSRRRGRSAAGSAAARAREGA